MAFQYSVSIQGTRQGTFKGNKPHSNGGRGSYRDGFEIQAFDFPVTTPLDLSPGYGSGKRQHKPVRLIVEYGTASKQLFQAFCTKELLSEIVVKKLQAEPVFPTVHLTNAATSTMSRFGNPAGSGAFPQPGSSGAGSSSGSGRSGKETVYETIQLTNATVTKYGSYHGVSATHGQAAGKVLISIELDYSEIKAFPIRR